VKSEVGVRELHDQLSRYIRHVAEGGEIVVTTRQPICALAVWSRIRMGSGGHDGAGADGRARP
jgi:hypothetical protein